MPETVTSLEILRLAVALVGAWMSQQGWARTSAIRPSLIRDVLHETQRDRIDRIQRARRIAGAERIHVILLVIQAGFAINAFVNLFYLSTSIEQLNVATSNILQVAAPLGMIAVTVILDRLVQGGQEIVDLVGIKTEGERWSHLQGRMVSSEGESSQARGQEDT